MTAPQKYRGEKLGLPPAGSGSLAPTGVRLGAFVVDAIASVPTAAGDKPIEPVVLQSVDIVAA